MDTNGSSMIAASNLVTLMVKLRENKMTGSWSEDRQMRQIAAYYDWALRVVRETETGAG